MVLPSSLYWGKILADSWKLRRAELAHIFIRKSMIRDERQHDVELRQARERNAEKSERKLVVFRGLLKHISELPRRHPRTSGLARYF